ncbi:hypothetical protein AB836_01350 [Rickettsiales bacterium (ex Bugula neritina AB1)]|nr:hypothetical protein AB836_01350 [Rickettsiales bacterium (ex Bugula neritina AB1)]
MKIKKIKGFMGFELLLFATIILFTIKIFDCIVTITNKNIKFLEEQQKLYYLKNILLDYLLTNNKLPLQEEKINHDILKIPSSYNSIIIKTNNTNIFINENSIGDEREIFSLHLNNRSLNVYAGELRLLKKQHNINTYNTHCIESKNNWQKNNWQKIKI